MEQEVLAGTAFCLGIIMGFVLAFIVLFTVFPGDSE